MLVLDTKAAKRRYLILELPKAAILIQGCIFYGFNDGIELRRVFEYGFIVALAVPEGNHDDFSAEAVGNTEAKGDGAGLLAHSFLAVVSLAGIGLLEAKELLCFYVFEEFFEVFTGHGAAGNLEAL